MKNIENQEHWTKLTSTEYYEVALARFVSVLDQIRSGKHPMGYMNLYSKLVIGVWNPYMGQVERIALKLMDRLESERANDLSFNLGSYNFELMVQTRGYDLEGKDLGTIIFRYNPDRVTDLDPLPRYDNQVEDDEFESDEDSP